MKRRLSAASGRWLRLSALLLAAGAAGCAQKGPGPLYAWEDFPRRQYETLLAGGTLPNAAEQAERLNAQAEKARATGAALPPGFRAHLGLVRLALGDPAAASALWQAEKAAFPESTPYMDRLLQRLQNPGARPAAAAAAANPG